MNQKAWIGAIVAVVIVLALPVVLNIAGITPATRQAPAANLAATPPPPPQPEPVSLPTAPQQAPPAAHLPPAMPAAPVMHLPPAMPAAPVATQLDANSLVGTVWAMNSPYGPVQVQLNPGGQLIASHSLIGAIPGAWQVQGNRLIGNASAMGQNLSIYAIIQGNMVFFEGQPLTRLR